MSSRNAAQNGLREEVERLGPWFHNIRLPGGVRTAPAHFLGDYPQMKFSRFAHGLPNDMSGKTVLDIGCNAGFYSFEMERRGADRVLGIDSDERYLRQARFVADVCGMSRCEFQQLSVWQVAEIGEKFDFVIFMGVLYHLRHPLLALDLIREHVTGDVMLFQTMQRGSADIEPIPEDHPFHDPQTNEPPAYFDEPGYPKLHFIEREYAGDWTNWWTPNRACSEAMLRAAGFAVEKRLEAEVYLCRAEEVPYSDYGPAAVYPSTGENSR